MSFHLEAKPGDIADIALLPGDPLRAEYVAREFLEGAVKYNGVRGMLGFTGTYRGRRVSVQGTGMGMPSALIYTHELIRDYGVDKLVRIGSTGSIRDDLGLRALVVAMSACTDSNINRRRFRGADFAPTASYELLERAVRCARAREIPVRVGPVLSSDEFYQEDADYWRVFAAYGVLCVEMETAALYTVAAKYGVHALSLLTVSDSLVNDESLSSADKQHGLSSMVEVALEMFV